jgi:hypothetical protein
VAPWRETNAAPTSLHASGCIATITLSYFKEAYNYIRRDSNMKHLQIPKVHGRKQRKTLVGTRAATSSLWLLSIFAICVCCQLSLQVAVVVAQQDNDARQATRQERERRRKERQKRREEFRQQWNHDGATTNSTEFVVRLNECTRTCHAHIHGTLHCHSQAYLLM